MQGKNPLEYLQGLQSPGFHIICSLKKDRDAKGGERYIGRNTKEGGDDKGHETNPNQERARDMSLN